MFSRLSFIGLGVGGELDGSHEQCDAGQGTGGNFSDTAHSKLHHTLVR
jgi:hypothetical protein